MKNLNSIESLLRQNPAPKHNAEMPSHYNFEELIGRKNSYEKQQLQKLKFIISFGSIAAIFIILITTLFLLKPSVEFKSRYKMASFLKNSATELSKIDPKKQFKFVKLATTDSYKQTENNSPTILITKKKDMLLLSPSSSITISNNQVTSLTGQAIFEIKDRTKNELPFTAQIQPLFSTNQIKITVLGTFFRVINDPNQLEVTLKEGKIKLDYGSNLLYLDNIINNHFLISSHESSFTNLNDYPNDTTHEISLPQKKMEHPLVNKGEWSYFTDSTQIEIYKTGKIILLKENTQKEIDLLATILSSPCFDSNNNLLIVNTSNDDTSIIEVPQLLVKQTLTTGTIQNSKIHIYNNEYLAVNTDGYLVIFTKEKIVSKQLIAKGNFSETIILNQILNILAGNGEWIEYDLINRTKKRAVLFHVNPMNAKGVIENGQLFYILSTQDKITLPK